MEREIKKIKKPNKFDKNLFKDKSKRPLICLACFVIFVAIAIIMSIVAFKIPVVATCFIVVLEAVLAICFNRIPLWIHGLIFIAQIVAGIIADHTFFMVLMAVIYLLATSFLYVRSAYEQD